MKLRLLVLNRSAVVNIVVTVTADGTAVIEFGSAVVNIVVTVTADGTAVIEFGSAVVNIVVTVTADGTAVIEFGSAVVMFVTIYRIAAIKIEPIRVLLSGYQCRRH